MSKEEQLDYAVNKMQDHRELAENWRLISVEARKKHVVDPDPRPDEISMKEA